MPAIYRIFSRAEKSDLCFFFDANARSDRSGDDIVIAGDLGRRCADLCLLSALMLSFTVMVGAADA